MQVERERKLPLQFSVSQAEAKIPTPGCGSDEDIITCRNGRFGQRQELCTHCFPPNKGNYRAECFPAHTLQSMEDCTEMECHRPHLIRTLNPQSNWRNIHRAYAGVRKLRLQFSSLKQRQRFSPWMWLRWRYNIMSKRPIWSATRTLYMLFLPNKVPAGLMRVAENVSQCTHFNAW